MKNRFLNKNVIAVIVTYNPDETLINNISQVMNQVGRILIIDNNSIKFPNYNIIKAIDKVVIINNQDNLGLAAALNQGLDYALRNGYFLMLTLDQDTYINDDALENMLDVLNTNEKIVSVGPVYRRRLRFLRRMQTHKKVSYLITSGNLFKVNKAIEVGGFNSSLFIDSIDFDFSLLLRMKGGVLALSKRALMEHSIGDIKINRKFGISYQYSAHSNIRYYYMYRNQIYILKKYFFKFPVFCIKFLTISLISFFKFLFLEDDLREKIYYMNCGISDAFKGKYGEFSNKNED